AQSGAQSHWGVGEGKKRDERRADGEERQPRRRAMTRAGRARQRDVGNQHEERARRENQLRQDVIEVACRNSWGHQRPVAAVCGYCGLTRAMMCCTDVSSRRRNGAGYRPIQTARIRSGAKVANSRWLKSKSRS